MKKIHLKLGKERRRFTALDEFHEINDYCNVYILFVVMETIHFQSVQKICLSTSFIVLLLILSIPVLFHMETALYNLIGLILAPFLIILDLTFCTLYSVNLLLIAKTRLLLIFFLIIFLYFL